MIIVKMEAENIKKLKAVKIEPGADAVVIGGKNGAGKSSVLDAIMYAIRGKASMCDDPIRHGEAKGKSHVEFGDYIVDLSITASGSTLTVKDKNTGARFPSPQAMLDKLIGDLSFDPLDFAGLDSDDQTQVLQQVAGIDLTSLDMSRATKYEDRTAIGREVKTAEGHFASLGDRNTTAPAEEVQSTDIVQQMNAARAHNRKIDEAEHAIQSATEAIESIASQYRSVESQIKNLTEQLAVLKTRGAESRGRLAEMKAEHAKMGRQDEAVFSQQLADADKTNAAVRRNAAIDAAAKTLKAKRAAYDAATEAIKKMDEDRAAILKSAKMPIPGLSITDKGVTYNDTLFSQLSSAEQLRVSVAIGMALNPKLRVIFVRNGALLDEDNLKIIRDLAKDNEYQLWIETVGSGKDVTVMIVDGEVKP